MRVAGDLSRSPLVPGREEEEAMSRQRFTVQVLDAGDSSQRRSELRDDVDTDSQAVCIEGERECRIIIFGLSLSSRPFCTTCMESGTPPRCYSTLYPAFYICTALCMLGWGQLRACRYTTKNNTPVPLWHGLGCVASRPDVKGWNVGCCPDGQHSPGNG
jgi:hypothetical protein